MGSYEHRIRCIAPDHYQISWVLDFKYPSSRLRYRRVFRRDTDARGARRFAKRWGISLPSPSSNGGE